MRIIYGLLVATICLPPLSLLIGREDGRVAVVLYDEPKLYALQILGWILIVSLVWLRPGLLHPSTLRETLCRPLPVALAAFLIYAAATSLWARVPENVFYEWHQYLLLFVLLILLKAWAADDPKVGHLALVAHTLALAPLIVAGGLQLCIDIPFLPPIDPGYGVRHPSFMGYKNPMALAILGQIFVLGYLTWNSFAHHRPALVRIALAAYLFVSTAYLVSLQSRTSLVALTVASVVLLGGLMLNTRRYDVSGPSPRAGLMLLPGLVGVLLSLLLLNEPVRARLATLGDYLTRPETFLESDRGTYLRNTLNMARHNPFGVGLGDWQTHYPLYRAHQRDLAFTAEIQARRAHNDHAQMLGELGFTGLVLWTGLIFVAVARPLHHFTRTGEVRSMFLAAQVLACVVAMAGDYLLELPYSKFQFFLVCGLTLIWCRSATPLVSSACQPVPIPRGRGALMTATLSLLAAGHLWYAIQGLEKSYCAMRVRLHHQQALTELSAAGDSPDATRHLEAVDAYGDRFETLHGHAKTSFQIYLAMAEAAWWQGRERRAADLTRRSLKLHPFHPGSFLLLSRILAQSAPESAMELADVHRYLLDEASDGFRIPYPSATLDPIDEEIP